MTSYRIGSQVMISNKARNDHSSRDHCVLDHWVWDPCETADIPVNTHLTDELYRKMSQSCVIWTHSLTRVTHRLWAVVSGDLKIPFCAECCTLLYLTAEINVSHRTPSSCRHDEAYRWRHVGHDVMSRDVTHTTWLGRCDSRANSCRRNKN